MGRYTDSVCRICRREQMKLFLKGERCNSPKCAFEKRHFPPGQHGNLKIKVSQYSLQLREKQRLKNMVGISEEQFIRYYREAEKKRGITGDIFLDFLERRLDNILYLLKISNSRPAARQLIVHGFVRVNGKKVSKPSYLVKVNDVISFSEKFKQKFKESTQSKTHQNIGWLEWNEEGMEAKVVRFPTHQEFSFPVNTRLIVEYYSK